MSFLFEKKELILIAILFLILLLIVVIFGVLYKNISDEVLNLRKNISLVPSTNEKIENNENILDVEDEIYVEIKGCIKNPGVYKMTSLNRVFEVIDRAGGLTKNADTSKLI